MSIIQGNSKTSAAGYNIDQSIRFNDNDSAYLQRTPGSAGNRKKFTISWWMKPALADVATNDHLFSAYDSTGNFFFVVLQRDDATFSNEIYFQSQVGSSNIISICTANAFRDPASWYHIVIAIDTDNATAADRNIIYVNGVRVTNFLSPYNVNASSGHTTFWNNIDIHYIGRSNVGGYYDGYMAEIYNIDGQALDPSSFGEVNADTGQWVPIEYTGSYGTNGFYITGENSAALGTDYSGNGNNFTSSGLTSADQVTDSPTDNYATLNPLLKHSSVTFADGNLEVSSSANGWFGSIGTVGIQLGDKVYFEGKCLTNTRLYFGLSRVNGSGGTIKPESDGGFEGGQSDTDYMWRVTSADTVYYQTTNQSVTVSAVSVNDIVGCSVDTDGTVKFYKNGTEIHSFSTTLVAGDTYMPVYSVNGATSTEKWEVRFGSTGISHQPAGFSLLRTSDMDDPTIADPTAHFNTVLWTATGATNAITGVGFQPDFIWGKKRTPTADNHGLVDAVRGNTKELASNLTNAELTNTNGVQSFDSDGFTLAGSGSGSGVWNGNVGATHVAWNWKANGSGTSNTYGSITSTVSANTTAGFSVVTYTGNSSASTVGHGLGVAPAMVIVKKRSGTAADWAVWNKNLSAAQILLLNSTGAAYDPADNDFQDTAPTSSVFYITGTNGRVNASGADFVAYCFAEVEGFSKFTSYEGNASTDGPFIYCGFRPSFVMIKNADAAEDWWIQDAAREPFNGGNMARIAPNSSAAEVDNVPWFDFVSNGLKVRYNAGGINNSGTHIVAAFAESPFRYANAR